MTKKVSQVNWRKKIFNDLFWDDWTDTMKKNGSILHTVHKDKYHIDVCFKWKERRKVNNARVGGKIGYFSYKFEVEKSFLIMNQNP